MTDVELRPYTESDRPQVSMIHDGAHPIELKGSCDPKAFVPLAEDAHDLKEFQHCQKQVACSRDRIVGFVGVSKDEIGWLHVDPEESGKGFG